MQVNTTEFSENEGLPKAVIEAQSQMEAHSNIFDVRYFSYFSYFI
jgi:hypothetical protein